jgi:iron(III) transport system permease protein
VQLSAVLLLFIFALVWIEQRSRRRSRYYQSLAAAAPSRYALTGIRAVGAWLACGIPVLLGLVVPVALLLAMTLRNAEVTLNQSFVTLSLNSLMLATLTALIAMGWPW